VTGSSERDNESSGSIKGGYFRHKLNDRQFLSFSSESKIVKCTSYTKDEYIKCTILHKGKGKVIPVL
jgi:hypothetical protein